MYELKECPFCGSRDVALIDDWYLGEEGDCFTVLCNSCGAMTRPQERPTDDDGNLYEPGTEEYEEYALNSVEKWNTRDNSRGRILRIEELAENLISTCKEIINENNGSKGTEFSLSIRKISEELEELKLQKERETDHRCSQEGQDSDAESSRSFGE